MKILENLELAIIEGRMGSNLPNTLDKEVKLGVAGLVDLALSEGISIDDILNKGMISGMDIVGQRFSNGEYFLPNLLMSAKVMKSGMAILEPLFKKANIELAGKVIMGTVKGDMHDIGKNLVSVILQGGGFEIIDLGVDVPSERFVDAGKEHPDAVIGMSALLTTTRGAISDTMDHLRRERLKNKVIVGGAVVSRQFADEIGADGFTQDAAKVVNLVNNIISAV